MENYCFMNESAFTESGGEIVIDATPYSNAFVNPESENVDINAPFYYREVEGDFVFRAKVSHDFVSTFDACVLFAYDNDRLWAKACFEYTDFGTHAVVSVMTNNDSDDSNSVDIDGNTVWLQLSRKGDVFGIHYSRDGKSYRMARLTRLPMQKKIKVGMMAQSPMGQGGKRLFADVLLMQKTLPDIRAGK
jgi:uncharacterized protein